MEVEPSIIIIIIIIITITIIPPCARTEPHAQTRLLHRLAGRWGWCCPFVRFEGFSPFAFVMTPSVLGQRPSRKKNSSRSSERGAETLRSPS